MYSTVQRQYTSPKWQSSITNPDKQFRAVDGSVVKNILELKTFLQTTSQETFDHHISAIKNDIADWVEQIIGDHSLSVELRHQSNRWGTIIALERHMLRTIALPDFVARRFLRRAHDSFIFNDGTKVQSLEELVAALKIISNQTFDVHNQKSPSDLALWVLHIVGDSELSEIIDDSSNRKHAIQLLTDYIRMLRNTLQ